MLRIALVSAPLTVKERYGEFSGARNMQPTFALVCLGAVARQSGNEVMLLDASAKEISVDEALKHLTEFKPDIVGITATTVGICASGELAAKVKKHITGALTVIGGCHVTAIPEETMKEFPGFDIAIIGEGELTFHELLLRMQNGKEVPNDLQGTVIRKDGEIHLNNSRPLIKNLDDMPLPAWDLLDGFPDSFMPSPGRIRRLPCASVVFSRGCPNSCSFCDRSVFGNRVRSVSPVRAVEIIKDLHFKYGVREILIEDDTFISSPKRVAEFCQLLIDQKLNISWSCLGRADRVKPELLELMKRAGCWHIAYGIESGDERILKAMHKNETIEQIESALKWSKAAGLKVKGFFIVGFPGETKESLRLTQELALRLPLDDISVMQLTPFPGTEIYAHADQYGTFERDWRKMNILNTVFIPNGFTAYDLEKARSEILRAFYFRSRVVLSKLLDILAQPRLFYYYFQALLTLLKVSLH
jgi:anaerobic magnesium-protoporphyrin IX monomethyl ester cyclase